MSKIKSSAIVLIAIAIAVAIYLWLPKEHKASMPEIADLPTQCARQIFESVEYVVCEVDLRTLDVGVFHAGTDGKAYGSLDAFDAAMAAKGTPAILAMNGGMYHEGLSPVGLLVEGGRELSPLDLSEGEGNFYLKPNGVFWAGTDGKAGVTETAAFATVRPALKSATQSGPMLVIDGQIHPRFQPDGTSRYIRNGIGARNGNTVVMAVSLSPVSLGSFARLFRDRLGCANALFLDGAISALSNGRKTLIGGEFPVGPIIAVFPRPALR